MNSNKFRNLLFFPSFLFIGPLWAGESGVAEAPASPAGDGGAATVAWPDAWRSLNDWDLGGVLFPHLDIHGIGGFSTGEVDELATGGHDPQRKTFSAQAIEPGLSLRTQYLEGFANYLFYQDADGDWDGELEEAFGKIVNIPGGFELKGGRYLSRFGALNTTHLHSWDFVDAELANTRFLGEDGLLLEGGELSWELPLGRGPALATILSFGVGKAASHDHGHGGHEDNHDDHDDHDDETPHDGEEAYLSDVAFTARALSRYRFSDFHTLTGGVSWAGGDNDFGRTTQIHGMDIEYLWRENGLEPGGRALRWRNELLWRKVGAFSEHDEDDDGVIDETHRGNYREWGLHSHLIYTWNNHFDSALRFGWVEGIDAFGDAERLRVSPALTWWLDAERRVGLRTQYNYDSIRGHDDEHSLWFQLNIGLGSRNEMR